MQVSCINVQKNPLPEPKYEFLGTPLISTGIWLERDSLSFQGTKFIRAFGHICKGKVERESARFLTVAHSCHGSARTQLFSLAEVQPHQAPTEDSCPGDVPWTEWAGKPVRSKLSPKDFGREVVGILETWILGFLVMQQLLCCNK